MSQSQRQRQNQKQKQVQAQTLRQNLQAGLDDLDLDEGFVPRPGPGDGEQAFDQDQEIDGDDWLAGTPGSDEPDDAREGSSTWRELLGSRRPRVHLRVGQEGESVVVTLACQPRRDSARAAPEQLRRHTQDIFRRGWPGLTADQRRQLLFGEGVTPIQRLALLYRLRVPGSTALDAEAVETTAPSQLGLERYLDKFAALADGWPFSLRLLLTDQRGRKQGDSTHGLASLPDGLLVLALQRMQSPEYANGEERDDERLGGDLRRACRELGFPLREEIGAVQIQRLRERLNRNRVGDLLPNKTQRRRRSSGGPP